MTAGIRANRHMLVSCPSHQPMYFIPSRTSLLFPPGRPKQPFEARFALSTSCHMCSRTK